MVHFGLNIKTCCLYVTWEIQDQIWAKIFASLKICTPVHLWLRFSVRVYGQGLGTDFWFADSGLRVKV